MPSKATVATSNHQASCPEESSTVSAQDLSAFFFSLSPHERKAAFASTARAAEIVGLSQRTIQFWIETGAIRAIRVGRKYQVEIRSLLHHATAAI